MLRRDFNRMLGTVAAAPILTPAGPPAGKARREEPRRSKLSADIADPHSRKAAPGRQPRRHRLRGHLFHAALDVHLHGRLHECRPHPGTLTAPPCRIRRLRRARTRQAAGPPHDPGGRGDLPVRGPRVGGDEAAPGPRRGFHPYHRAPEPRPSRLRPIRVPRARPRGSRPPTVAFGNERVPVRDAGVGMARSG
jgi:hypothetical protein